VDENMIRGVRVSSAWTYGLYRDMAEDLDFSGPGLWWTWASVDLGFGGLEFRCVDLLWTWCVNMVCGHGLGLWTWCVNMDFGGHGLRWTWTSVDMDFGGHGLRRTWTSADMDFGGHGLRWSWRWSSDLGSVDQMDLNDADTRNRDGGVACFTGASFRGAKKSGVAARRQGANRSTFDSAVFDPLKAKNS